MIKYLISIIVILLSCNTTFGQLVSSHSELTAAISNASAGTTIILSDQTWTDVQISINKNGTAENPIIIKAQTPGSVFFEGRSNVSLGGSYIIFEGVIFQNASGLITSVDKIEPIIEFRDTSNNDCVNCHVRNIKIDSYNGTSSQETLKFKWIIIYGEYNEVSYSSFIGKNGVGSIINDNHNNSTPDYSKIHHNYFADRVPVNNTINGINICRPKLNSCSSKVCISWIPLAESGKSAPKPMTTNKIRVIIILGTVVHNIYWICSNKLVPAIAGARFVVSERGDILSPK